MKKIVLILLTMSSCKQQNKSENYKIINDTIFPCVQDGVTVQTKIKLLN